MEQKSIRLLRADEIECRIGTISEKGLSLLLYKDARADMKILDEVYGPMGWQRKHEVVGGNLYCTVSIWDDDKKQWIEKMDVGTESYTEKEKGQASDSFKRACVSLGIGRELYTAPFIWVSASKVKIENRNGKLVTYDKFKVANISYSESREIVGLTILNQKGKVLYSLIEKADDKKANEETPMADSDAQQGSQMQEHQTQEHQTQERQTQGNQAQEYQRQEGQPQGRQSQSRQSSGRKRNSDKEQEVNRELARTGVALDAVLERYGVASIYDMNDETYRKAINSLKRTRSKAA